jgi:hypothetical protein
VRRGCKDAAAPSMARPGIPNLLSLRGDEARLQRIGDAHAASRSSRRPVINGATRGKFAIKSWLCRTDPEAQRHSSCDFNSGETQDAQAFEKLKSEDFARTNKTRRYLAPCAGDARLRWRIKSVGTLITEPRDAICSLLGCIPSQRASE